MYNKLRYICVNIISCGYSFIEYVSNYSKVIVYALSFFLANLLLTKPYLAHSSPSMPESKFYIILRYWIGHMDESKYVQLTLGFFVSTIPNLSVRPYI